MFTSSVAHAADLGGSAFGQAALGQASFGPAALGLPGLAPSGWSTPAVEVLTAFFSARPFDPALSELLWTGSVSTLLLLAGVLTVAMLPWTDREIGVVHGTARGLFSWAPLRALARR